MPVLERREHERVAVGLFVREIVGDTEAPCFTMNVSSEGLLVERPAEIAVRSERLVQVEIPLSGEDSDRQGPGQSVWGLAEVVYAVPVGDGRNAPVRTALRFTAMAERDHRRWCDWLSRQEGGERWEDLGDDVRVLRPA